MITEESKKGEDEKIEAPEIGKKNAARVTIMGTGDDNKLCAKTAGSLPKPDQKHRRRDCLYCEGNNAWIWGLILSV